jgi:predicted phosphodiesterase
MTDATLAGAARVLLAGDVHGNTSFVTTLLDHARNQDCPRIVALGDWGAWEHTPDGRKFVRDVEKHAAKRGITIWWLDGNHDKSSLTLELHPDRDPEGFHVVGEHVRHIPRGHRWEWDGVRFAAFGGAYSVDKQWRVDLEKRRKGPGTLWFPEEEMTDDEFGPLLGDDPEPVDVLLAHDKPRAANPQWNRKDIPECWPNQDRIQAAAVALKPKLLVHGHLHYRYSDRILIGDDQWCRVEGLAADPDAMGREYFKGESWMVLDLAEVLGDD